MRNHIIYVSCLFWLALELPGLLKANAQVSAQLNNILSLDEKSGPQEVVKAPR